MLPLLAQNTGRHKVSQWCWTFRYFKGIVSPHLSVVEHTYNPRPGEVEVGRSRVQS